jgi:hypothetical protein
LEKQRLKYKINVNEILIKKYMGYTIHLFYISWNINQTSTHIYILILLINQLIHNETFISVMKIELTAWQLS